MATHIKHVGQRARLGRNPFYSWLPTNLPNLVFWARADQKLFQINDGSIASGDGDVVGYWGDLSGQGNHEKQATTANKPLLRLNQINGRPAIWFDGVNDSLSTAAFSAALSQPNTIFAVYKRNVLSVNNYIFDGIVSSSRHAHLMVTVPDRYDLFAGLELTGGTPTTNSELAIHIFNGGSSILRINGTQILSGDAGSHTLTGLRLGTNDSQGVFLDGVIAEIGVYNVSLNANDIGDLESYLSKRYGITLP